MKMDLILTKPSLNVDSILPRLGLKQERMEKGLSQNEWRKTQGLTARYFPFGNKNFNQVLPVVAEQSCKSIRRILETF